MRTPAVIERVPENGESPPFDEETLAGRTVGVFMTAQLAGEVSRVHVVETAFLPDFRGPDERSGRCVARVHHLVIGVEGRHVPGDLRRNGGDEPRDVPDLPLGVVVSR